MAKEVKELVEGVATNGETEGKCQCGGSEDNSILWAKVMVAKLTVLDKIVEGIEGGANIEHCLTLSNIYKNLC